ncbi:acetyl-CoA carboxylase biotin carboxylase subunit [Denitratisoma oestradiolicum]|uniref:Biotin carboxylase / Biotin carboxyl carrier protein n=1 Tax=Denitratisoma oestradiolicum TaxID=311182 RepID=A0A6S6YM09_9PROT|nr:acetyl/propionyl/methylcrotonyl-CoA carboxylase subunit alpha [Denitratisoma oestradiolicum]TWO81881.1 3-methylcrotonyl-CoA carboxylase [Denitratisoma oestradiolicum]CAB1368764.1 Biotin carboxylase / Biotin carboxyl carrier protein [Denitratisoma oestradiolicum]
MFERILIANRGEIACRVIRTARRMGIRTVAVYSAADAEARHVRLADEAVLLGPAAPGESYLAIDRIIAACRQTGAQAVHPGYGFLSENGDFADAVAAQGLVFIGPPASAIRAMGSKSEARKLMEEVGLPVTPGYHGDEQAPDFLKAQAERIGYPVLIKAIAGGGGRGMRAVHQSSEFLAALASCKREAAASFGNEQVLIEKYLQGPRHVEIQIFSDRQGHCVHLFERDCSVQRRHQKILEEAPAPGMTPQRRGAMGQAAIVAAQAIGYVGAGTVEFLLDREGNFHFMEMNTRLQVEHPVTEMITGLDLVEWQLRIAAGEPLPLVQEQLSIHGHALEARICAEDPDQGFLPASGRLVHLAAPEESLHVRVDTGVEEGDEISPHYDSMIAKLIVWDETRERACARMLQALARYRVVGVANNVDFLSRLVACPAFAQADLDTGLVEREHDFLFPAATEPPAEAWLVVVLAELLREQETALDGARSDTDPHSPWHLRDGWRINSAARRTLVFRAGEAERSIAVAYGERGFVLEVDGRATAVSGTLGPGGQLWADLAGRRINGTVVIAAGKRHVFLHGRAFVFAAVDPLLPAGSGGSAEGGLSAPMPGRVVALIAQPGKRVEQGAPLLILEAMKMEHTIIAPAAGTIKRFRYGVGDQVEDGAELLEFEVNRG